MATGGGHHQQSGGATPGPAEEGLGRPYESRALWSNTLDTSASYFCSTAVRLRTRSRDAPFARLVIGLDAQRAQLDLQLVRPLEGAPALGRVPLRHEVLDLLEVLPAQGYRVRVRVRAGVRVRVRVRARAWVRVRVRAGVRG
eukprot:scaffold38706_cov66-Phaeocystis_antarctica.AAC.1